MLITAAADLHLAPRTLSALPGLREQAQASSAEVLIIAGDLTTGPVSQHTQALEALAAFPGLKLFVPGNHDLWQRTEGRDTWRRYTTELAQAVSTTGFHYLDAAPVVHDGYGFVGCMGWYDYTLRQQEPPDADVRLSPAHVRSPGGAFHVEAKRKGLRWHELTAEDYRTKAMQSQDDNVLQGLVWNDGFYIDWGRPDEEMVGYFCEKLQEQGAEVASEVDHLVAVTHFVPFADMIPNATSLSTAYVRAFAGSARLGETILGLPKVKAAVFGHWHQQGAEHLGGIIAANVSVSHLKAPPVLLEL